MALTLPQVGCNVLFVGRKKLFISSVVARSFLSNGLEWIARVIPIHILFRLPSLCCKQLPQIGSIERSYY